MNTEKKIEQCLKAAPKPPAQDGLLDKLHKDIALGDIKTRRSALRRWFAPTGGSISPFRVAAAAVIAIALLLPLSYGAVRSGYKIIEFVMEREIEGPDGERGYLFVKAVIEVEEDVDVNDLLIFPDDPNIPLNFIIPKPKANQEAKGNGPAKDEDNQ
jgi:hypothetical protein